VAGGSRWTRGTAEATARLTAAAAAPSRAVAFSDLEGCPRRCSAYLRMALRMGSRVSPACTCISPGGCAPVVESDQWLDFEATGDHRARRARLRVDARIPSRAVAACGDARHLHRRHRQRRGGAAVRVGPGGERAAGRELDAGNLYRLLAEAAWAPTLLLPREGLTWARINDHRALASLTQGGENATVEFRFNDAGEIAGIFAAERPRSYGTTTWAHRGKGASTATSRWTACGYRRAARWGWWIDDRWVPVWRATVTQFRFDLAGH
jgi:hypothetical protein